MSALKRHMYCGGLFFKCFWGKIRLFASLRQTPRIMQPAARRPGGLGRGDGSFGAGLEKMPG
jgi:hypothetical protein